MRSLRSKLASTDICDICSHHEQEYLHKYSVVQRKCGNVFDQHKDCKPRQKSLREITRDKLCSLCRTHLQKLSVQAPEEFPTLDLPIPGPPTSYLNEELPLSASTESTSNDSVVYGVDIEEVIHYLNLTPVKLGTKFDEKKLFGWGGPKISKLVQLDLFLKEPKSLWLRISRQPKNVMEQEFISVLGSEAVIATIDAVDPYGAGQEYALLTRAEVLFYCAVAS
ncbi:hypothetical protein EMCRGX_G014706 [Ephydatia muelleri]